MPAALPAERDAVMADGLASSPWQQIDDTPTPVNGRQHTCHVVGNPLYTAYRTHPSKHRLAVLTTLLNGQALTFRLSDDACLLLAAAGVSPTLLTHLRQALPWDVALRPYQRRDAVARACGCPHRTRAPPILARRGPQPTTTLSLRL